MAQSWEDIIDWVNFLSLRDTKAYIILHIPYPSDKCVPVVSNNFIVFNTKRLISLPANTKIYPNKKNYMLSILNNLGNFAMSKAMYKLRVLALH